LISVFCATLLSGCVTNSEGGTDVTALASSLPQVKEFLDQYPNAKVSVALWDSTAVEKNLASIQADCGAQFAVGDYYKVSVVDPSFSLVIWLYKSSQNVMCAVKAASANPTYVPTGNPTQLPGSTVVPAASTIPTTSPEFPPMPPEEQTASSVSATPAASTELPPMPPGSEGNASEELTYEKYACTKNGGWWNPCASPCEGREDAMCAQVCVAKCVYANRTVTPTPASGSCVTVGRSIPVVANPPKCCESLVLNASAVPAGADGISGYCTYPVPQVAEGCKWVGIECSHKGAYWTGKPIECNKANEGLVGMGPGAIGGAYLPESYTSEEWGACFTPRAMCDCGNATVPTPAPSPAPGPSASACADSDGNNLYTSGHVTLQLSDGTSAISYDYCSGPSGIVERLCYNNSVLDRRTSCAGQCFNGACANATAYATPTPGMPVVGGGCAYASFNGTCRITGTTDSSVRFWFEPQDKLDVASRAPFQPEFGVEKTETLSLFVAASTAGSALSANRTYSCSVSIETQGTCTPVIYRLS